MPSLLERCSRRFIVARPLQPPTKAFRHFLLSFFLNTASKDHRSVPFSMLLTIPGWPYCRRRFPPQISSPKKLAFSALDLTAGNLGCWLDSTVDRTFALLRFRPKKGVGFASRAVADGQHLPIFVQHPTSVLLYACCPSYHCARLPHLAAFHRAVQGRLDTTLALSMETVL